MNRTQRQLVLAYVLALFAPIHAHAEVIPTPGPADARVRVATYNPNDVVKLNAYVGYQIHIQWAEGEEFVNLGSGDNAAFDVGADRHHFFIKPRLERALTNVTVLTNRRAYHFEYRVSKVPAGENAMKEMIYSLRFIYPEDDARVAQVKQETAKIESSLDEASRHPKTRNTNYWFCGSSALKPVSAFDDGVHTRLRFAARGEFPAVFVKNDDKSESLINFSVQDDELIIHRIAKRLVLRRGLLVGCVVNRAFDGGSDRLPSGTLSPEITRKTQVVKP